MKTQTEMAYLLLDNIKSHYVSTQKNKIILTGITRKSPSIKLTYLKRSPEISMNIGSFTKRFSNDLEMITFLGSVALYDERLEKSVS